MVTGALNIPPLPFITAEYRRIAKFYIKILIQCVGLWFRTLLNKFTETIYLEGIFCLIKNIK